MLGMGLGFSRRTRNSGCTPNKLLPFALASLVALIGAQSVMAGKTNDRRYEFGDGGTNSTQDSQFISTFDQQDLSVPSGFGSPAFVNVSGTGLNRPGRLRATQGLNLTE